MNGFIYILSNPVMPGIIKIGKTTGAPEARVHALSAQTACPMPFFLEDYYECDFIHKAEKTAHEALSKYRLNRSREFFRVDLNIARSTIEGVISGKIVINHDPQNPAAFAAHNNNGILEKLRELFPPSPNDESNRLRLKNWRKESKLSQIVAAAKIGVSQGSLASLETGGRLPSLRIATKIHRLTNGAVPVVGWTKDLLECAAGGAV